MNELEDLLRAIGAPDGDDETALELTSLQVIQLVDLIEATFEVVLTSAQITRANFASRAALTRMLA